MNCCWYRSRFFGLGLTGLLLLVSMWLTHRKVIIHASYHAPQMDYIVLWGKGKLGIIESDSHIHHVGRRAPGFGYGRLVFETDQWLKPVCPSAAINGEHLIRIRLIVAVYSVAWLGGLIWWQRRKHRLKNMPFRRATDLRALIPEPRRRERRESFRWQE
ncbi:MAG: hypothetical protein EOP88_08680 [Verrucomicrobiaceae bacterium]|nr:MAG: hypothetical protein EOP88_08680 [Verrucomicrobiaceae bacterium]